MPSVRCEEHAFVTCVHGKDEVRWCTACARIVHVAPRSLRVPPPHEYVGFLRSEITHEEREARERPWVDARLLRYRTVSRALGHLDVQVAPHPEARWRQGGDVEMRGVDLPGARHLAPMGTVLSVDEDRLVLRVRANEGLARLVGMDWVRLEVRLSDPTQLLRSQLRVYNLLLDTPIVEGLTDPGTLPRLDPWRPEGWIPLRELDPAMEANPDQALAFAHALRAPEGGLALVQGPPGTGKTRLLANVIRAIQARGGTVLVASHTNVAVDNVLERLLLLDPDARDRVARLGNPLKVSPPMQALWADWRGFGLDWEAEDPQATLFSNVFRVRPLVGTTLSALASRMAASFSPRYERFDYVLVDEASMNFLPFVAMALHAGKRLVLVGDHRQLPPIVRAPDYAARPGFSMGTFEHVGRVRPDLLVSLRRQYRSLPGIMDWANEALYGGRLETMRSGDAPRVRVGEVVLPGPAVWVDTTRLPRNAHVVRASGPMGTPSFANARHLALAVHLTDALLAGGTLPEEIAFISPYRLQADLYASLARARLGCEGLEASTVDRFQGREKRVVLYDVTTTAPQRSHESVQRLNVSLTRAKDLLVVLGPRGFSTGPSENVFYYSLARWFEGRPVVDATALCIPEDLVRDASALAGEA